MWIVVLARTAMGQQRVKRKRDKNAMRYLFGDIIIWKIYKDPKKLSGFYIGNMYRNLNGALRSRCNVKLNYAPTIPTACTFQEGTAPITSYTIPFRHVPDILKIILMQSFKGLHPPGMPHHFWLHTHDLATVKAISDEIVVMLNGCIVEKGPKKEILKPPHHEYTDLLLSSVPEMDPDWLDSLLQARAADMKPTAVELNRLA
jgi:hypothetical protein